MSLLPSELWKLQFACKKEHWGHIQYCLYSNLIRNVLFSTSRNVCKHPGANSTTSSLESKQHSRQRTILFFEKPMVTILCPPTWEFLSKHALDWGVSEQSMSQSVPAKGTQVFFNKSSTTAAEHKIFWYIHHGSSITPQIHWWNTLLADLSVEWLKCGGVTDNPQTCLHHILYPFNSWPHALLIWYCRY